MNDDELDPWLEELVSETVECHGCGRVELCVFMEDPEGPLNCLNDDKHWWCQECWELASSR